MMQDHMYDLMTGKPDPNFASEFCNLIYCIGESTIPVIDYCAKCTFSAEIHVVSSIEEAVRSYNSAPPRHGDYGMPYSHFFVLYNDICDIYIAGNHFLRHYNMRYEDDYEGDIILDFWLFRARYHRNRLPEALQTFTVRQHADVAHIVESSQIKIDGAETIDTILGHPVIGHDTWDCSKLCECCNPKAEDTGIDESDRNPRPETENGERSSKASRANSPRRSISAYMFFSLENRPRVRSDNPGITFGEIGKTLGMEWKDLSDDVRIIYEKKAADDKARYQAEKVRYSEQGVPGFALCCGRRL